MKMPNSKPMKMGPAPSPNPMMGGGGAAMTAPADLSMAQPKAPGGQGFLINPGKFSDSHAGPPSARGQRKSAGYPSFSQNP